MTRSTRPPLWPLPPLPVHAEAIKATMTQPARIRLIGISFLLAKRDSTQGMDGRARQAARLRRGKPASRRDRPGEDLAESGHDRLHRDHGETLSRRGDAYGSGWG